MLNLREKLLNAGLVTDKQVKKVEENKKKQHQKRKEKFQKAKSDNDVDFSKEESKKYVAHLKSLNANGKYLLIRKWVQKNRLDKDHEGVSVECKRYFFKKIDGNITWLTLKPETIKKVDAGDAAIISFMSNSGMSYCVIPKQIAKDIAQVFPLWLRVLAGEKNAGQIGSGE